MQDARGALSKGGGVLVGLHTLPTGLHANQPDLLVIHKLVEEPCTARASVLPSSINLLKVLRTRNGEAEGICVTSKKPCHLQKPKVTSRSRVTSKNPCHHQGTKHL